MTGFDDLHHRPIRRLRHKLKEAGYDIAAGLATGKSGKQMLAEAKIREALADDGLDLHEFDDGYEVHDAGRRVFWGTLDEIGEWIEQSKEYQEKKHG